MMVAPSKSAHDLAIDRAIADTGQSPNGGMDTVFYSNPGLLENPRLIAHILSQPLPLALSDPNPIGILRQTIRRLISEPDTQETALQGLNYQREYDTLMGAREISDPQTFKDNIGARVLYAVEYYYQQKATEILVQNDWTAFWGFVADKLYLFEHRPQRQHTENIGALGYAYLAAAGNEENLAEHIGVRIDKNKIVHIHTTSPGPPNFTVWPENKARPGSKLEGQKDFLGNDLSYERCIAIEGSAATDINDWRNSCAEARDEMIAQEKVRKLARKRSLGMKKRLMAFTSMAVFSALATVWARHHIRYVSNGDSMLPPSSAAVDPPKSETRETTPPKHFSQANVPTKRAAANPLKPTPRKITPSNNIPGVEALGQRWLRELRSDLAELKIKNWGIKNVGRAQDKRTVTIFLNTGDKLIFSKSVQGKVNLDILPATTNGALNLNTVNIILPELKAHKEKMQNQLSHHNQPAP